MNKNRETPEDLIGLKCEQMTLADLMRQTEPKPDADPEMMEDPLYPKAVAAVREKGKASPSMLQRLFCIGFIRADKLITRMEEEGVIGPYQPGGYRKINKEVET